MEKIDFRKALKPLYTAPAGAFVIVDVPDMQFVKVDGKGDPNTADAYRRALEWLYSVSYAMKFAAKAALGRDYVVPPLEGLWWSDDYADFATRAKDRWSWTMMIMAPAFISATMFEDATRKAAGKLGEPPPSLRLEAHSEGMALQTLHVGSYDDEGPVLARLHGEELAARRLVLNGLHHEIYLNDPRRTEASRLRTILRQPVRPA